MTRLDYQAVGDDIYCIDTGLYRPRHTAAYLVREGDQLAFIDTGTSNAVPALLGVVAELGLTPEAVRYVMPTHVHLDHAGGAGALMAACPNAQLVTHPKGLPHMIDPGKLQAGAMAVYGETAFMRDFGNLSGIDEGRCIAAEDNQTFSLNGRMIRFIDTPGHANHHGCFLDERSSTIFTGDTYGLSYREFDSARGATVLATTTPVAFDPDAWLASLDKIAALQPDTACPTHFGPISQPLALMETLKRGILAHAEIALREEQEPGEGRAERLRTAVAGMLIDAIEVNDCGLSRTEIHDLLAHDIELNAQGLEIWLKRRARRREPS